MTDEMQAPEAAAPAEDFQVPEGVTIDGGQEATPPSDPSTEQPSTEQPDKVTFDERQQAVFDNTIAEKVFKQREAERKAAALEQQLQQMQAQAPQQVRPDVPPIPSPYDFDTDDKYQAAVRDRDAKIMAQAQFDANQQALAQQQQQHALAQQQAEQQKQAELAKDFEKNATKHGLTGDQIVQDSLAIGQRGGLYPANPEGAQQLMSMVLTDPDGPKITAYLAQNPQAQLELQQMDLMTAGITLMTSVKQAAGGIGPKIPGAPNPPEHLRGAGAPEKQEGPPGATYE